MSIVYCVVISKPEWKPMPAIQNGIKTPNEIREVEGMEPLGSGNDLMIQGATVPISAQTNEEE